MVNNKKKRKTRTSDSQLGLGPGLGPGLKRKKMNVPATIALTVLIVTLTILGACAHATSPLLQAMKRKNDLKIRAEKRKPRLRTTWKSENARFSNRMFFRMFRMHRACFVHLCEKIERAVGEKEFKSEKYIEKLMRERHSSKEGSMMAAHVKKNGPYIPGEIKVAMTLRILAGASYLDMYLWFNVNPDYVRHITRGVMRYWFCNDNVVLINFYKLLDSTEDTNRIRTAFAKKSNGIMNGCIGAIDGWVVKIRCPAWSEVLNPGKYFSRKGFYGINVQAIVAKNKKILWRSIGHKGSSHDSKVFNESGLGKYLVDHADDLYARGLYLVGDSAYALRSYMLTPHDNALPDSKEDNFNFFLSSNRIYVECAFGEIDRRWGIFWSPLEGSLQNHQYTIDAAIRMHNFIVEFRELQENEGKNVDDDLEELNIDSDNFLMNNPSTILGPIAEETQFEHGTRGRPTTIDAELRMKGKDLRNAISYELHRRGFSRPCNQRVAVSDRHNRRLALGK